MVVISRSTALEAAGCGAQVIPYALPYPVALRISLTSFPCVLFPILSHNLAMLRLSFGSAVKEHGCEEECVLYVSLFRWFSFLYPACA